MTEPVALNTLVWGTGSRRALLLHGLSSAGSTWWRVAPALASKGFTVVAPDLRAHGMSPKGDRLSIPDYRDDVLLLGNGWDLLLGHSLGGAIAVSAMTEAPGFAKRLVLEDPAMDSAATEALIAAAPEPDPHPTLESVAAANPGWHPHDVELKVEALRRCGVEAPKRTMHDASPWDVWDALLNVAVPTLVVGADPELGTLVPAERGEEAVRSNPRIRFTVLDGAGHSIHRDESERFVALMSEFWRLGS